MIKTILSTLVLVFSVAAAHGNERPLINSHLRVWDSFIVESHLKLGADLIELDISSLSEEDLQKSLDLLDKYPGKFIALHMKGMTVSDLPQIESLLFNNKEKWAQLWFFSGDSKIDSEIRLKFSLAHVSRSTKRNLLSCLRDGLSDEQTFITNCIERDLWIRPTMMANQSDRLRMKQLVEKIRSYEKSFPVSPSLIALDQIDSTALYCDFFPEFSTLVDGIVSEDFTSIAAVATGLLSCP